MEYMNKFISSLQDHGIPINPVPGILYSYLDEHDEHGFPLHPPVYPPWIHIYY